MNWRMRGERRPPIKASVMAKGKREPKMARQSSGSRLEKEGSVEKEMGTIVELVVDDEGLFVEV